MTGSEMGFDDRDGFIWLDGGLVPWREAKIHVLTHALHYGSSVFEGVRAYGGTPFKLNEHSQRLIDSAKMLDMDTELSVDDINKAVLETIAANNLSDCYIRPLLWRGPEKMGVAGEGTKTHFSVATWAWPSYFSPEKRLEGIKIEFSKWKRPSPETIPAKAKAAGLYMICTLAKDQAARNGYDDALMLDYRGLVAEATGANIFFLKDGVLHTPTPDCFLDGITRRTAIDLATRRGVKVVERAITPDELPDFTEAFLTGTAAEITPLSEIGPHKYSVGEITKNMVQDYDDLVHERL
ncbi:MAG: branched-chain amino acid aminotransferase [Sphingomonadales bacterium]|nr:branched-chain amino acid aminotransferase [Sphingomonadales bacterium]